ncbi:MAG: DUF1282 domain-containing protein [Calditrichaeota bacterium]|nr:MAG: DUF1282 domain-containing protein [Calditrichota bacterium]
MEAIVERVKKIILTPRDALTAVRSEDLPFAPTMKEYVAILAAIPAVAQFIGYALIGLPFVGRQNIFRTLIFAILSYVLSLVGVVIFGKIINMLASTFNAVQSDANSFKLAVYSYTPVFVAGIFNMIPSLSILSIFGALYGIYVLYLGIPVLMEAPQEKAVAYTVVSIIVAIVVMIIIGAIAGALAWGGAGGPARYF